MYVGVAEKRAQRNPNVKIEKMENIIKQIINFGQYDIL